MRVVKNGNNKLIAVVFPVGYEPLIQNLVFNEFLELGRKYRPKNIAFLFSPDTQRKAVLKKYIINPNEKNNLSDEELFEKEIAEIQGYVIIPEGESAFDIKNKIEELANSL